MSNKCEHNNHSHYMLWAFVWICYIHVMDCSGADSSMKHDIWKQQQEINNLQYEVSRCKK